MKDRILRTHNRIIWLELLALTGWIALMGIYISPGSFTGTLAFMLRHPLLIPLNALPVAAVLLLIFFACRNSFLAGGITNLLFGLMSYANLLKIDGRDDPFVPGDIILLREALQATGDYRLDLHPGIIALVLLSTAIFIALGICLGRSDRKPLRRIIGAVLTLTVFLGAFFTIYRDRELYASFPVSNEYKVSSVFDELGFNYCFLYNFDLYAADRPAGYSAEAVEERISDYPVSIAEGEKPQLLMIMCEAFSDLNDNPVFTYSEEDSPLRGYHRVLAGGNCVSGEIVVPNFGAGTANTEFDVITGMQTNLINTTSNSAMRSFFKDIPTMATALKSAGYDSVYMHPGLSWFYNRDSALSHMGFDEKLFVDDFTGDTNLDSDFLVNLKRELAQRTASGEKLFTYANTIQNHQAYTYDKYDFAVPDVQVSVPLSDEAKEYLSVYSYGVKCSSDMLEELTEYLNGLAEPYVLVFFGDHLPNLGANYLAYRELGLDIGLDGTPEEIAATCSVPYIVWANDAYMKGRSADEVFDALDLPEGGRISACYLGEIALELAGCENADPYFAFLGETRRLLPVIKTGITGGPDGTLSAAPNDTQQGLINALHCWQYYRMT